MEITVNLAVGVGVRIGAGRDEPAVRRVDARHRVEGGAHDVIQKDKTTIK